MFLRELSLFSCKYNFLLFHPIKITTDDNCLKVVYKNDKGKSSGINHTDSLGFSF